MNELGALNISLTFSRFDVFKGHVRAWITHKHLSIQRKHDVHLSQVNHTADHISRLPLATEWLISNVPLLSLWVKCEESNESQQFRHSVEFLLFYYSLKNPDIWGGSTNSASIEDVGQLVGPKLCVGTHAGSGPTDSHLTRGHRFKLKVPLALGHCIGFLCAEDAHLISSRVINSMSSCRRYGTKHNTYHSQRSRVRH